MEGQTSDWLRASGDMAERIRAHDWATTPLGAMDVWPQSLRIVLPMVLQMRQPASLCWGPEARQIYNDAYRAILGDKHPGALGEPLENVWREIADEVRTAVADTLAGGSQLWQDAVFNLVRHDEKPTKGWFTASWTPITAEDGSVGGFLLLVTETTTRYLAQCAINENEKRQRFLLELSDAMRAAGTADAIIAAASRMLGERLGASRIVYAEIDDAAGLARTREGWTAEGAPAHPATLKLSDFGGPLFDSLRAGKTIRCNDVGSPPRRPDLAAIDAIGVKSGLSVPLVVGGRFVVNLNVHQDRPRVWTDAEVALTEEVAERIWAAVERSRAEKALRAIGKRLRQFGEASQDVLWMRDAKTLQWAYLTPAFETIYGLSRDEALEDDNYHSWLGMIVPMDREHAAASIARAGAGEHVTFEYRIRRAADDAILWMQNTVFPIVDAAGTVVMIGGVEHDATELRETEWRLKTLIEGIPQLIWRAEDGGEWTWASPQWIEYTGQSESESLGWGWLASLHPEDRPRAREAWSHATERNGIEVDYRIRQHATGAWRWFHTRAVPACDRTSAIIEWLGTSTDVHDLRQLQERQEILVAELQHRTRNLMGVVQSIADKTIRTSDDLPDFRGRFHDRIAALARVQGLLSRLDEHDRVTFNELIETELSAMGGDAEHVIMDGPPDVRLRSSTVQTLAMAIHELATNAAKYGAIGQAQGHLAITWSLDPSGRDGAPWLHIDWRESGVEMSERDASSRRTGQGRELIEKALPYQLDAETAYRLTADGVHCTISIPVSERNVSE